MPPDAPKKTLAYSGTGARSTRPVSLTESNGVIAGVSPPPYAKPAAGRADRTAWSTSLNRPAATMAYPSRRPGIMA
jgi:hypothetical protein